MRRGCRKTKVKRQKTEKKICLEHRIISNRNKNKQMNNNFYTSNTFKRKHTNTNLKIKIGVVDKSRRFNIWEIGVPETEEKNWRGEKYSEIKRNKEVIYYRKASSFSLLSVMLPVCKSFCRYSPFYKLKNFPSVLVFQGFHSRVLQTMHFRTTLTLLEAGNPRQSQQ